MTVETIVVALHLTIEAVLIVRVMLRPHREPTSRIAWVAVIAALPFVGMVIYLLFGEVNIGRSRVARMREIVANMPKLSPADKDCAENLEPHIPAEYQHLFNVGVSITGFSPFGGNSGELMADSNATIDAMVRDIDNARLHVHLMFYIWLPDNNGRKIVEALKRAAARGVKCRAMADGLGSRTMIRSEHWRDMRESGVDVGVALPLGNLLRMFVARVDLRNHRKIMVIDDHITYCGSQNCADPEFLVKAKYAPWVDAVIRFVGPIARQNQHLFASDWMAFVNEDLSEMLKKPISAPLPGISAQVIGTGPTVRNSAMPEMFESLIYAARQELVITTPYYVPDESMQNAICSAGYRGVPTTMIFPAKNDSQIVGPASRSYYADLLAAGVRIFEYQGGLLHTKSLTLDGQITLIGSANMDRRSFDLNYENNILFYDPRLTNSVRQRQNEYLAKSREVTRAEVAAWSLPRRFWNNTLAVLGPVL